MPKAPKPAGKQPVIEKKKPIARWHENERFVRSKSSNRLCPLTPYSDGMHAMLLPVQAAALAGAGANERHADSGDNYRIGVTAKEFPAQMKIVYLGPEGQGRQQVRRPPLRGEASSSCSRWRLDLHGLDHSPSQ